MKLQLIALLTVFGLSAFAQKDFTINGKIELDEGNLLVLSQRVDGVDTLASAPVHNGTFVLKGTTDKPVVALLKLEKFEGGFIMMLEPGKNYTAVLTKTGAGDIKGGTLQEVFNRYREVVAEGNEKARVVRDQADEAAQKKHFKTVSELNKQADDILFATRGQLKDLLAPHASSVRLENPNMVALFNDYKDKGLNIISVSLDDRKAPWLKAIEKDIMPWTHVSSLDGWKCKVLQLYNIETVPTILILDENNRIIGKDLRAEALRAFIAERLK